MMSSSFAQSTLTIKAFVESYYYPLAYRMKPIIDPINAPLLFDTITIELHKPSDLSLVFIKKKVFNVFGNASITLPEYLIDKHYYIVLRHRNSIETWSKEPVLIHDNVYYNFTSSVTQAAGNNLKWVENAACIYSGDINQDGHIDLLDFKLWDYDNSLGVWGYYLNTDLDGDWNVGQSDFPFWDNNNSLHISVIYGSIISNLDTEEISYGIYPNPTNQFVEINFKNIVKGTSLEIFSATGMLVDVKTIGQEIGNRINLSNYTSGIYIFKFSIEGMLYTEKIIVQH